MVRFILSDGQSSYENGVYTFLLDQNLSNARVLRLKKATYTISTDQPVVPHVVYIRSKALHKLAREKHTLQLTATQHENSVDVLGVLEETHTTGRYRLMHPARPLLLNYSHVRDLDFYFTDKNGANLNYFTTTPASTDYPEVVDDMAAPTDTEKTGVIFRAFDTGGSGANYGNDEALNRVYISTNGKGLILDFQSFATETTYDKLTVRSRNETTDAWTDIFIDHTGSGVPSGNPFTTTHKRVKFWWASDSSTNDVGWDAVIYEDWGSDGTLGGDSSAGFTLTVTGASTTYGETTSDSNWFAEMDIATS